MGRFSNEHRLEILNEIGQDAQDRYNEILDINHFGYNLDILHDGLQFKPNAQTFTNDYWVDYGDAKLNLIAHYFEHGTGINNTLDKKQRITPTQKKVMKFVKKGGGWVFAASVKGVKPLFMFERTMSEMKNNEQKLKNKYHLMLEDGN